MIKLFLLALAFVAGLSPQASAQQAGKKEINKITLATIDFPPYSIENALNGREGFDIEVVREAFRRINMPVEIIFQPWNHGLQRTLSGEIEGIFSCAAREKYQLSAPISSATNALFFNRDFDFTKYPIQQLEDLQKYPELKIGGVASYKHLDKLEALDIDYTTSPDNDSAFQKLFAGKINVFLSIREFGDYTIKGLGLEKFVTSVSLDKKDYFVCFSKAWVGKDETISRFNQALQEMRADHTIEAIHAKYR